MTSIVSVLSLQGDFREHIESVKACGFDARPVKDVNGIKACDALIIPGGESTTIAKLARIFGVFDLIKERIAEGLPVYGSCAGMILLADELVDAPVGQETFGGLDISVRRNAFGRQVDSFESELIVHGATDFGPPIRAVFIRAPWVERVGSRVEVLASISDADGVRHPVAVREGKLLATSFHPEISGDTRIHQYFLRDVCGL